jgi:hypothetical protein
VATYRSALAVCPATGIVRDALQDLQLLGRVAPPVAKLDEVMQLFIEARADLQNNGDTSRLIQSFLATVAE